MSTAFSIQADIQRDGPNSFSGSGDDFSNREISNRVAGESHNSKSQTISSLIGGFMGRWSGSSPPGKQSEANNTFSPSYVRASEPAQSTVDSIADPSTPSSPDAVNTQNKIGTATPIFDTSRFLGWRSASKGKQESPDSKSKSDKRDIPPFDLEENSTVAAGGDNKLPASSSSTTKTSTDSNQRKEGCRGLYFRELANLLCAAASLAAAISSYQTLQFAATDVRNIVQTWQSIPISNVMLVPSTSSCPSNFTQLSTLYWPGATTLGCGCPSGASYSYSTYTSTSGSACSSSQLAAGCVTNVPNGLSGIQLDRFRGSKICYQRGLASYVQTEEPDSAGACPALFHKCGSSNGTYSSDRSQCVPDSLGSGCPLTWLGSDYFFSQTRQKTTKIVTSGNTPPKMAYKSGAILYKQEQRLQLVKLQLPIIDLAFSIQQNGGDRGPCYKGASQSAYVAEETGLPTLPAACTSVDARWVPLELYPEQDLLGENFIYAGHKNTRCSSYSTLVAASEADYFKTGLKCNNSAITDDLKCESGISSNVACDNNDVLCHDTYYQSRCGRVAHTALSATKKVGIYMRQQTYWKESCPKTPTQVRETSDPFNSAIQAQYALLIVNCIINGMQAILSVYLIMLSLLAVSGLGSLKMDDTNQMHLFRLAKIGQVCKLPVIIASIVTVHAIYAFYQSLSSAKCSDDITNVTFDTLGSSLPGVLYGNIATLVCDGAQVLLIPGLLIASKLYQQGAFSELSVGWGRLRDRLQTVLTHVSTPNQTVSVKIKVPKSIEGIEPVKF